jgi:alkaline phosphatase D
MPSRMFRRELLAAGGAGAFALASSVTSGGDGNDNHDNLTENPWIKYNAKRRGYVRVTLDANELRADFRILSAVTTPNGAAATGARFTLQNGRPGADRLSTTM